jgi:hypothetical protein
MATKPKAKTARLVSDHKVASPLSRGGGPKVSAARDRAVKIG